MVSKQNIQLIIFALAVSLIAESCGPGVYLDIQKRYPTLDYRAEVEVLGLNDEAPENAINLGSIKIGDTGFSLKCGYNVVVDKAKQEARKIGGNVIKIMSHKKPDIISSCHRIVFQIFREEEVETAFIEDDQVADNENSNATIISYQEKAKFFIYRLSGDYPTVNYDLFLEDNKICKVTDNFSTVFYTTKKGSNNIWNSLNPDVKLPIDIVSGNIYYIKCDVVDNAIILKLMNPEIGKKEYESLTSIKP